jgi:hypothetical protein
MMVVLAILVMTATLFPLALDHALPARRVKVAAEHLRAALVAAQIQSIYSGHPVQVSLGELQPSTPHSVHLRLTSLDGGVIDTLIFFPDGSSSGARCTLTEGTHESTVSVSAVTGHLSVEPSSSARS